LKSRLKSGVEQSMAKAEFDRLRAEDGDKTDDDIIDELSKMTTTVKGIKVKLFSDGTISHLKSTVVERSEVMTLYNELKAKNNSHDACIAEIKASDKIPASAINWLMGTKNGTTTVSNAHIAVKSKTIKATKKQEDMVVRQKQGTAKGRASMAEAKRAVADPNRNASKRQQTIAENWDKGIKKRANTQRLNQDIKTLEKGGDKVMLQCTKKNCGDTRPFALIDTTRDERKNVF